MRGAVVILLVGCGARSELDISAQSTDASALDVADAAIDVGDATNDVSTTPHDAAACLNLPEAACTNEPPYDSVLSAAVTQCSSSTSSSWVCGFVDVSFDANGCAIAFAYEVAPAEFRACFEATVSSQRWPCETGQTLSAFLGSCTVN